MRLPYSSHSKFLGPIEHALAKRGDIIVDHPVVVELGPRGYERDVLVIIRKLDQDTFETDWESDHPTRFSARIRAAATALRNRGIAGRFRIKHFAGTLTIEPT